MELLHRLARKLARRPYRVRHARAMRPGSPYATVGQQPGIDEVASVRIPAPQRHGRATYPFDLDIGEVVRGHHLIAQGITLTEKNLILEWTFVPEVAAEASGEVWPNMNYDADVSPSGWNQAVADWDVFERPVPAARYVWFDFFRPDYDWMGHHDRYGQPDSDYLRNRIARLTFDLKTREAQIEE